MHAASQVTGRRQPAADSPQRVVRMATREDVVSRLKQQHREREAQRIATLKVNERGLGMKLIRVEQAFDGFRDRPLRRRSSEMLLLARKGA